MLTPEEALRLADRLCVVEYHDGDNPCEVCHAIADALLRVDREAEERGRREAGDARLLGCLCNCHDPQMPNMEPHPTCVDCQRALVEEAERLGRTQMLRAWWERVW